MIAGIATASLATGLSLLGWLSLTLCLLAACGILSLSKRKSLPTVSIVTLMLLFFAIGAFRGHQCDPSNDSRHWTHIDTLPPDKPVFLTLQLKESPSPRTRSWRTLAEVQQIGNQPTRGTLRLYLRNDSTAATLRYGDILLAHGYTDRERESLYLTSDHYLVTGHDSTSLRSHSERLRMKLLRRMQEGPLEPRYRGVAEALTLGWRGDLDADLQAQFRNAGIMHLLCVSGLHVGLLAAIVSVLLFFIGKDRRGRILRGSVQLAVIWTFAAITGLAPATVRAALMFSLFIVSHMMGRRTDTLNLLAAAAIVMLAVDPMLLFNVGWQLSFSAVAGILLMRPALRLHHNILWRASVVCLAATLATLPVSLATFHQFMPYFLIANIVIVPLSGLILAVSLLHLALPCGFTAFLVKWPLWLCDWLTAAISKLPGAVITDIETSPWHIALLSAAIILIFLTINITLLRYQSTNNNPPC